MFYNEEYHPAFISSFALFLYFRVDSFQQRPVMNHINSSNANYTVDIHNLYLVSTIAILHVLCTIM